MFTKRILLAACTGLAASAGFGMTLPDGTPVQELTGDALWGCQVHLCLANPNGPKAVAECVPPIDRLIRECFKPKPRHRRPFPTCAQAGPGSYARVTSSPWDPCPLKGLVPAKRGWIAEGRSAPAGRRRHWRAADGFVLTDKPAWNSGGEPMPEEEGSAGGDGIGTMACVRGEPAGSYVEHEDGSEWSRTVTVYEEIFWQKPQPRTAVDIYVDGRHWNRTHFSW